MRHGMFWAMLLWLGAVGVQAADRPNILWLTSEDHGPHMGCYGDKFATTPNVDGLAKGGCVYLHAWSTAPVCAPARTTLISGMYAPSLGGEQMRSMVPMPEGTKMFPQYLRAAGYYCTNNSKEDYNLKKPGKVWDVSSGKGHWKNRKEGQPFFAVFNSTKSHESRIRTRPHKKVHDPAKVRVPAYHPDTQEVRQDWAQYYDKVTAADADAGQRLRELEEAGLADDTIVFYYGDHGSGMPRSKRWPFNSGLHVPLVVYIPPKWKGLASSDYKVGGTSDRLVGFVDFGPTVLSLAGVEPPEWMQGRAFLGKFATEPRKVQHGFRGRMDERYDLVRSVTDGRYIYIRNYMPHLIYGQHVAYMFQTPTTQVWKKLHDQGKLNAAQDAFWNPKPSEELYDLHNDPDEVNNLAKSPEHQEIRKRLRSAQQKHAREILDIGFLPEGERFTRSGDMSPYDMARTPGKYPFDAVFDAAELATMRDGDADVANLRKLLKHDDSAVRYWGALGLLIRGPKAFDKAVESDVRKAMQDESPYVCIVASQMIATTGNDLKTGLTKLVELSDWSKHDVFVVLYALNALDVLGTNIRPMAEEIRALPSKGPSPDRRYASYVPRLLADLRGKLK